MEIVANINADEANKDPRFMASTSFSFAAQIVPERSNHFSHRHTRPPRFCVVARDDQVDQHRPAAQKQVGKFAIEFGGVLEPNGVAVAGTLRHRHEVESAGTR
jgi:hypothetical protein